MATASFDMDRQLNELKLARQAIIKENEVLQHEIKVLNEEQTQWNSIYQKAVSGTPAFDKISVDDLKSKCGQNDRLRDIHLDACKQIEKELDGYRLELQSTMMIIAYMIQETESMEHAYNRTKESEGSLLIAFELLFEQFLKDLQKNEEIDIKKGALKIKRKDDKTKKERKKKKKAKVDLFEICRNDSLGDEFEAYCKDVLIVDNKDFNKRILALRRLDVSDFNPVDPSKGEKVRQITQNIICRILARSSNHELEMPTKQKELVDFFDMHLRVQQARPKANSRDLQQSVEYALMSAFFAYRTRHASVDDPESDDDLIVMDRKYTV